MPEVSLRILADDLRREPFAGCVEGADRKFKR